VSFNAYFTLNSTLWASVFATKSVVKLVSRGKLNGCENTVASYANWLETCIIPVSSEARSQQYGIYKTMREKLRWLSIQDRIKFKLYVLVYKS
jgi:hypothetical protein